MAAPGELRKPVLVGGLVAVALGLGLLVWGLAPAKGFSVAMGAFGGGSVPDDLGERLDATMTELGSRVWADGLGTALLLGGFVALKAARVPPRSVEQQVEAAVEARLAGMDRGQGAPAGPPLAVRGEARAADEAVGQPAVHDEPAQDVDPTWGPVPAAVGSGTGQEVPPDARASAAPPAPASARAAPTTVASDRARVRPASAGEHPPAPGRCTTCGGVLIAGGRFCADCGPVAA